jgi:hypothetical protein
MNELGRMWSKTAAAYFEYYTRIFLKGLRKPRETSLRITCIPAGIQNGHLQNTSHRRYQSRQRTRLLIVIIQNFERTNETRWRNLSLALREEGAEENFRTEEE